MSLFDVFRGKDGFWALIGLVGFGIISCVVVLVLLFGMALLWGL